MMLGRKRAKILAHGRRYVHHHGLRQKSRRRIVVQAGIAALSLVALWYAGLVWFAGEIPDPAGPPETRTDAVVVLTGGSGRLEAGLDLLDQGWAGVLFVSGVYERVDVRLLLDMFRRQLPEIACCIELGYAANDTRGNAAETARWMSENGLGSLRLVTSSYHMPRALYEFGRTLPDATIVAHAITPQTYDLDRWWRDFGTFRLLAVEYSKFLLAPLTAHLAVWLGSASAGEA